MRLFFVVLLFSWLVGIAMGGIGISYALVLAAEAVLVTVVGLLLRMRLHIVIASMTLLFFGVLYGAYDGSASRVCTFSSPLYGYVDRVYQIRGDSAQYVVKGNDGCAVLVTTNRFPEYYAGDDLKVLGDVQLLVDMPEEYKGYADYLDRQGIAATVRFVEVAVVRRGTRVWGDVVRDTVRDRIYAIFLEPDAALVQAMILAERGVLPEEVQEQFRRAGVSHILAISGLHVSLFAGMLILTLLMLPIHPYVRVGIAVGFLWMYILLIGAPVSAVRASYFWTIVLFAAQLRLLINLPTVFLLTVTAMVTYNVGMLDDVGFQLSVFAVLGIGLTLFLARPLPRRVEARSFFDVLFVSIGAVLATWPLVAYHFGTISLYGLIANLLIIPVVPIFLASAILSILISFIIPSAALAGGFFVHILWLWMNVISKIAANLPWAYVEEVILPLWGVVLYYIMLCIVSIVVMKISHRSWREVWQ